MLMKKTFLISVLSIFFISGCGSKSDLSSNVTPESQNAGQAMTEAEAKLIAEKTCIKGGEALGTGAYNDASKTWVFDANLNATREGCSSICVVSEISKTAGLNWNCTGALESDNEATGVTDDESTKVSQDN